MEAIQRAAKCKPNLNPVNPLTQLTLTSPPLQLDHELQSLEAAGIQRLAAASETELAGRHMDRAFELKRLAKSMLLNFLELVGLMGHNTSHVSLPHPHPTPLDTTQYLHLPPS